MTGRNLVEHGWLWPPENAHGKNAAEQVLDILDIIKSSTVAGRTAGSLLDLYVNELATIRSEYHPRLLHVILNCGEHSHPGDVSVVNTERGVVRDALLGGGVRRVGTGLRVQL